MPSSELSSIRQAIRAEILDFWGENGTWRARKDGGWGESWAIVAKVQWRSKMLLERYSGTNVEAAEVYLSRDESLNATYRGVNEPSVGSELELESEPGRPLIFRGDVLEKSPERIKILMERPRRILTGGRS